MLITPKPVCSSSLLNLNYIQLSPYTYISTGMSKIPFSNLLLRRCFLFHFKVQYCFTVSSLSTKLPLYLSYMRPNHGHSGGSSFYFLFRDSSILTTNCKIEKFSCSFHLSFPYDNRFYSQSTFLEPGNLHWYNIVN